MMKVLRAMRFNPWYVGGGVKRYGRGRCRGDRHVSILGMLEGVLKDITSPYIYYDPASFNPWYVGGGVKSFGVFVTNGLECCFNPWYVGGGVKREPWEPWEPWEPSFNPWYVGGGVKSMAGLHPASHAAIMFQSLVCWRGC